MLLIFKNKYLVTCLTRPLLLGYFCGLLFSCSPKHMGMMVFLDKSGKVLLSVICQWNLFFHFSVEFCLVTLESLVIGVLAGLWLYLQAQTLKNSPLELPVCGFLSFCLSSERALFALWCVRACFVAVTMFWSDAVLATRSQNNIGAGSQVCLEEWLASVFQSLSGSRKRNFPALSTPWRPLMH